MFSSFARNHKVVTALGACGVVGGAFMLNPNYRIRCKESLNRVHRTAYFSGVVGVVIFDYWKSFRHVTEGTEEYKTTEHAVNERNAQRIYRLCDHLGGYFAKFGQMASTMKDKIPEEYTTVLAKCQDNLSPIPFSEFNRVIREDLGADANTLFSEVDSNPVGCASLAQVHRGKLKTGEEVAIKVQYPSVARDTQVDLRNMEMVTRLCERIFPRFQYSWFVPKVRQMVEKEFDFLQETENMRDCRAFFASNPSIYVPKPFTSLCSKRIVVMEYIDGVKVSNLDGIEKMGVNKKEVGQLCAQAFSEMIFGFKELHMDPHAGNLLVRTIPGTNKPQLVLLDHGMYMHFREGFNHDFQQLWLAMITQDKEKVRECCKPWHLEDAAEVLMMLFTGRGSHPGRKLGEGMSKEEAEQFRREMQEKMMNLSKPELEERMKKMQETMKNLPIELAAVLRVQMMLIGLLQSLGVSESERLNEMTYAAVRSAFGGRDEAGSYYRMLKWRLYLLLLRLRLWWGDVVVEYYYRRYMRMDSRMHALAWCVCSILLMGCNKQKQPLSLQRLVLGDGERSNARLEMAKSQLRASDHSHGRNLVSGVVNSLAGLDGIVDVRVVQLVTRNGEADKVQHALLLLLRLLVVLEGEGTKLASTNAVVTQQLDAEAHAGEGQRRHVGNALEELVHVQVDGVTAGGEHHGQTLLGEALGEATHLVDSALQVRLLLHLEEAHGAAHHVAAAETTVGVVSVLEDLLLLDARADLHLLRGELLGEDALVSEGEQAADVHETVLLQGHGEAVAVLEALLHDARDAPGLVGLLELLDEARVLHAAAGVEHQRDVVLAADGAHLLDVGDGDGLAGGGVVRDGEQHDGNSLHTVLLDHLLQALRVHVALPGVLRPDLLHGERVVEVLREQVHRLEEVVARVALRRVEEAVRGDDVLHLVARALVQHVVQRSVQQVLGAAALRADEEVGALQLEGASVDEAALVGGQELVDQLFVAGLVREHLVHQSSLLVTALEQVASGIEQAVVSVVSAVSLVTTHEGAPLDIGHGGGARVRQVIHSNHGRREGEHVVFRLLQDLATLLNRAVTTRQVRTCISYRVLRTTYW